MQNQNKKVVLYNINHLEPIPKENKLFLDIDIPQSSEIRQSISANSITDSLARKVGQIYTFCIEDSTDEDYNDFYINIAAWDKKG